MGKSEESAAPQLHNEAHSEATDDKDIGARQQLVLATLEPNTRLVLGEWVSNPNKVGLTSTFGFPGIAMQSDEYFYARIKEHAVFQVGGNSTFQSTGDWTHFTKNLDVATTEKTRITSGQMVAITSGPKDRYLPPAEGPTLRAPSFDRGAVSGLLLDHTTARTKAFAKSLGGIKATRSHLGVKSPQKPKMDKLGSIAAALHELAAKLHALKSKTDAVVTTLSVLEAGSKKVADAQKFWQSHDGTKKVKDFLEWQAKTFHLHELGNLILSPASAGGSPAKASGGGGSNPATLGPEEPSHTPTAPKTASDSDKSRKQEQLPAHWHSILHFMDEKHPVEHPREIPGLISDYVGELINLQVEAAEKVGEAHEPLEKASGASEAANQHYEKEEDEKERKERDEKLEKEEEEDNKREESESDHDSKTEPAAAAQRTPGQKAAAPSTPAASGSKSAPAPSTSPKAAAAAPTASPAAPPGKVRRAWGVVKQKMGGAAKWGGEKIDKGKQAARKPVEHINSGLQVISVATGQIERQNERIRSEFDTIQTKYKALDWQKQSFAEYANGWISLVNEAAKDATGLVDELANALDEQVSNLALKESEPKIFVAAKHNLLLSSGRMVDAYAEDGFQLESDKGGLLLNMRKSIEAITLQSAEISARKDVMIVADRSAELASRGYVGIGSRKETVEVLGKEILLGALNTKETSRADAAGKTGAQWEDERQLPTDKIAATATKLITLQAGGKPRNIGGDALTKDTPAALRLDADKGAVETWATKKINIHAHENGGVVRIEVGTFVITVNKDKIAMGLATEGGDPDMDKGIISIDKDGVVKVGTAKGKLYIDGATVASGNDSNSVTCTRSSVDIKADKLNLC